VKPSPSAARVKKGNARAKRAAWNFMRARDTQRDSDVSHEHGDGMAAFRHHKGQPVAERLSFHAIRRKA